MIDLNPNHLRTVRRILAEHVPECEVRAFGSRVTWTAKDYSDLDLAVVGARPLDADTMRLMKEAFEESDLPFRVDVLDWHGISENFRKVIEAQYEVLQKGKMNSGGGEGSGWRDVTVEEIAAPFDNALSTGPFGSAISAKYFVSTGVPVIRGSNLTETVETRLCELGLAFVSQQKAREFSRSITRRGDLIFTCWGTIGQVGLIDERANYEKYVISNKQMKLSPDPNKADSLYLYYCFSGPLLSAQIKNEAIGSSVPGFNLGQLKKIRLRLPPLTDQRAIAHILGTLDDKIGLNRRMNETLEAMARALFKSWFVDFDPVRAKMEGRWKRGESLPGLPGHLYDLFPGRLADSELGEIPGGWRVDSFSAIADIIGGGTPKTSAPEYWNGDIPWFSVVDAPCNSDIWVVDTEKKITPLGVKESSTRILQKGITIISARGTVGKIALVGIPMAMNQSCYGLQGKMDRYGFFTYLATRELISDLRQRTHGSVFDTITRDTFTGVTLVVPPVTDIEAFEEVIRPVVERVRVNLFESRTLAAIRDTLLPKLISGELRVPDAERFIEGAV